MSDLHEEMKKAAMNTQHQGSDLGEVIEACDAVAQERLNRLLDLYKKRGDELNKAADAELELAELKAKAAAHSDWRKAANVRMRELETQLAEAATNGLTKREQFAAMAMQGLLTNMTVMNDRWTEFVVKHAVTMADTLLQALDVKP